MVRLATAILIAAITFSARAAATSQPATTEADALLAAISAQKETNSLAAKANPAATDEELKAKLDLVRTLRFQKSFELAEKQAGDLVTDENPAEIKRLAMLE